MSTRLYVGQLSYHTTSDIIRQAFSKYGEVTDIHIVTDRETGRSRGYAFVTMGSEDQAEAAVNGLNDSQLDGKKITVRLASKRTGRDAPESAF